MSERSRYGYRIDRKKLRSLRMVGKGWGQEELAAASGLATGTVNRIEKGVHIPQLGTARKLARALGVKTNDLVIWDEDVLEHYPEAS